eukprot:1194498-Prorocentrum_minimum.AAC.2
MCNAQDQLHIVIRKQLSSAQPKYKRIGIIGGVTLMGRLARVRARVRFPSRAANSPSRAAHSLLPRSPSTPPVGTRPGGQERGGGGDGGAPSQGC